MDDYFNSSKISTKILILLKTNKIGCLLDLIFNLNNWIYCN